MISISYLLNNYEVSKESFNTLFNHKAFILGNNNLEFLSTSKVECSVGAIISFG